jgi:hypothetical protein
MRRFEQPASRSSEVMFASAQQEEIESGGTGIGPATFVRLGLSPVHPCRVATRDRAQGTNPCAAGNITT